MPIRPQLSWEQDKTTVRVFVPLKGTPRKDVDIYSSSRYVKVNFAPYLLSLDLHDAINDHDAKASFADGQLIMALPKATEGEWSDLEIQGVSKPELRERRAASIAQREAEDAKLNEARRQRKAEASDLAFRRHMALENAEREELESRKADERREAEKEMYEALAKVQREAEQAKAKADTAPRGTKGGDRKSAVKVEPDGKPASEATHTAPAPGTGSTAGRRGKTGQQDEPTQDEPKAVPAPRSAGRVALSFSERHFPTPLRQSKIAEEQDWLARNKHLIEARKRAEAADQPGTKARLGDISKRDPDWLKSKADEMFRSNDLFGAANTYTEALKRDATHLAALGNRAVCRLRLGHDKAAALDCTTALMLLPKPPVDPAPPLPTPSASASTSAAAAAAAAKSGQASAMIATNPSAASTAPPAPRDTPPSESAETRSDRLATIDSAETLKAAERLLASAGVSGRPELTPSTLRGPRLALRKALTRRATAWLRLGQFARAVADYQSLVSCSERDPGSPDDGMEPREMAESFRQDAALAQRLLDADTLKRQGDDKLRAMDAKGALRDYEAALAIEPAFVPALVNRATAHAAEGNWMASVQDCTDALESLGIGDEVEESVEAAVRSATASESQGAFVPCWGSVRLSAWIRAACLRRAAARMKSGKPRDAARDYRRALETDPLNTRIMRDLQQATAALLVASGAVRESTVQM